MRNTTIIIFLFTILPLFVGSIFLQIILSKKRNKFLGLILPTICLLMSLVIIMGSFNFMMMGSGSKVCGLNSYGVTKHYMHGKSSVGYNGRNFGTIIYMTVLYNIPTFTYLGIYFSHSKHRKELNNGSHEELMKMNIQDLE